MTPGAPVREGGPLRGRIPTTTPADGVRATTVAGDPLDVRRSRRLAARGDDGKVGTSPSPGRDLFEREDTAGNRRIQSLRSAMPDEGKGDFLYLGLHVRGTVALTRAGEDGAFLEPGDMVFCDPARRDVLRFGEDCLMTYFRTTRHYLGVAKSDLDRFVGVPVRHGAGMGALVSGFLSALAAEAEFHRPTIGDRLARSAVDLLAVLVMELLQAETGQERSGASKAGGEMLARIRAFIEEHLREPELSPESIARAHHISVRYLHKLFQDDGTTVGQWVRQRRLDSCRHELGRTSKGTTTVAAVAHRWGFSSPSHFSRTFRDAYGMSPSEWQALAASGVGSPITERGLPTGPRRGETV
ncbi:helix-turn-helix domain-containing protein [Streptomyces afghaniensis]|uniref:helix-turn-helix domain-containing protein n=1 Tax=Streptomyces afghaniensis TaxID=66865 RepID=UPI0037AFF2B9